MAIFAKVLKSYLKYQWKAQRKIRLHSPFMYTLVKEVFDDKRNFYAFDKIESLRKHLLMSSDKVKVLDLGAGSRTGKQSEEIAVKSIARKSAATPKMGQLLFKLVNHFQPETVLELGTSLGIGTHYLAAAKTSNQFISIEGNPAIAKLAQHYLDQSKLQHVEVRAGSFEEQLPGALKDLGKVDLAYIDGDHREAPTLAYFNQILPYLSENALVIMDDIHWSSGMEVAWNKLCAHEDVKVSADLFRLGLLFFMSENRQKSNFTLRW